MAKARITDGGTVQSGRAMARIDTGLPTETEVRAITANTPANTIQILQRSDAKANAAVAYFVYGIPKTSNYCLMDLNSLPVGTQVTVEVVRDGKVTAVSRFRGGQGNVEAAGSPQLRAAPGALVPPENMMHEKDVIAMIEGLAGAVTAAKSKTIQLEYASPNVFARLEQAIKDGHIGAVRVGRVG